MRLGLLLSLVLTSGCLDDNPPPRGPDDLGDPAPGGAGADGGGPPADTPSEGEGEGPGDEAGGQGEGEDEAQCPEGTRWADGECRPRGGEGEGEGEGEGAEPCPEGTARREGECRPDEGGGGPACEPIGDRELCGTGVDEDCDGTTDEGFEIDEPCEAGRGACHRVGEWVCTVDARGLFCDVQAGAPSTELCGTDVDEDCDGAVDERFAVGDPCEIGLGGCRALGQWECSEDRRGIRCSAQRGDGRVELCGDGVDNDCDGEVDEAAWVGDACTAGIGPCLRAGVWECGPAGGSRCSATPGDPEEPDGEVTCDGRDNDCDGVIDEFPAGGGPCEAGVGVCHRRGELICQADGAQLCSVRAGAPQEVDERRCDGLDNDCDGEVDEGMGLGLPCDVGVGACRTAGVTACDAATGDVACSARVPQGPEPGLERTCDDLDGDCDGTIDEGCDDDDDGRCDAGMTVVGAPAVCPDSPEGAGDDCDDDDGDIRPGLVDDCDGVDQDCDGDVDEAGGAQGARCVPPYVGALAKTQGRWGYGGEVGRRGAEAACGVLAAHGRLCQGSDLVAASEAGDLAGAVGQDGLPVTSVWVDTLEGARCVRDVPWSENDPDANVQGHVLFLDAATGAIVSERDTICSVPRHVACCGWD